MHFKHPEILYFLFLLIVPILVHLFQLRRFKKEYFTNVRFLKALSIQTRKSSKIKKWLLLACRLLLLTCIVIAFAQPFFESEDSKNSSNEMYIILDNSFSMQAKGKKGELLKRAVQELLEETPENASFSLLTNTDTYWATDIKTIRNELQNLKYSAVPFQLDNILAKVKAHKSAFKKDIVVITDAVGLKSNQLKNIETDNVPYFIIPKAEQKNNTSIDSVFIRQTLDDFYELSINTTNYSEDFKPISMALYNQNKLIAKTIINFKNKKETINFTIPKQAFHGHVSIEDNDLAYDNKLFFSISNSKKNNIISIGTPEKNNFLSRIYTSDEFNYSSFTLNSLDYNSIDKQDAIILNELDEIPQALQTTLKAFVKKGGNLIIIPSETESVSSLNALLNQFGSIKFESVELNEKQITKINFSHPLFAGVFENKTNNFQYPKVKKDFTISSSSPAILNFEDDSPFLIGLRNTISSVYVFSAPLNAINSNFQQSPLIVPVFYKMALSKLNNGVNSTIIGNSTSYLVSANLAKDEVLTVKNQDGNFTPVQQLLNNKVQLFFNDYPEKAGNYTIYDSQKPIENISFNYPRTESNLDQVNENILSDYKTSDSISTIFDTLQSSRSNNQIWKWFIIFALLFLALEMAIIKFVK
ncbi:vWA domain-containing protein [Flavobacterium aquicola]|uniref:Putative membrane protein (TIGR02226 family) n=1 Tax=Flavobacterium aquicola TaxID=1682742 RepID=A0A3E0EUL1_9FLAO|nr:BatA and WFA domain-containing protein [Flavobacterium aquicola]REH01848.1 putative membrane protein (TIGR02226 family) [Flavobacterium aquicola]